MIYPEQHKRLFFFFITCMALSCSSGDNDHQKPVIPPVKAILQFPSNHELCLNGDSINDTQSTVSFTWIPSDYTTTYELTIRNLNSGEQKTYNSSSSSLELNLTKGDPYEWFITSKSDKTEKTATSDTWQFYLAGNATTNHAPFPASIIYPDSGANVSTTSGTISLEWNGADVDDDVASFDVYLDSIDGKTTLLTQNVTKEKLDNVLVQSNTLYYWQVITYDISGNNTGSGIFSFKTR